MRHTFLNTLSGRFLGLMVVFVIIAEVLIFVPSVARYRLDYLQNRLELAQLGALALLAAPEPSLTPELGDEILRTAGVYNIVLQRDEVRELIIESPMPVPVATSYFLEQSSELELMRQAVRVLLRDDDRVIRVVGRSERGLGSGIEITVPERPLRTALWDYGRRILLVSLAITLATAALLFFAVRTLIVRPIDRVVAHMMAYRDDPEDARRIIVPSEGAHELVEAETALRELQLRLTAALKQKERLAALGGAVAKISHDLRNMLTTAQLLADRLETSADPAVRRTAPKLVASLSRAVSLCERTMTFGRAEESAPELADVALAPLVEEVVEAERLAAGSDRVSFAAEVPPDLRVRADADQLFRVLTNLVRNAGQAIEAAGGQGAVRVSAARDGASTTILVCDSGPGLPPKARENLFQPFRGGARRGGAGLGLVIAAELIRGHGGTLALAETGPAGTTFRITLPA